MDDLPWVMADETPQMGEWTADLASQPMASHHLYFRVCPRFLTLTQNPSFPLGLVAFWAGPQSCLALSLAGQTHFAGAGFPLSLALIRFASFKRT